jgi:predicted DNA-binding transcriptional regulator AlpA
MTIKVRTNIKGQELTLNDRFMRAKEVARICGTSRTAIYHLMGKFKFPPSHAISDCSVGWLEYDIEEYMRLGPKTFHEIYGEQLAKAKAEKAALAA